jgi:hypothetical protein
MRISVRETETLGRSPAGRHKTGGGTNIVGHAVRTHPLLTQDVREPPLYPLHQRLFGRVGSQIRSQLIYDLVRSVTEPDLPGLSAIARTVSTRTRHQRGDLACYSTR